MSFSLSEVFPKRSRLLMYEFIFNPTNNANVEATEAQNSSNLSLKFPAADGANPHSSQTSAQTFLFPYH